MATRPALEFSQLLALKVQSASQGLDSTSHDLSSYSAIQSHPDILSDSLLSLYSTLSQSPQAIISTESYSQYSHAKSQKINLMIPRFSNLYLLILHPISSRH